jgi:hypothetical protein
MSTSNIKKRLDNLERELCPTHSVMFTLEELCRSMWHQDKKAFLKMAKDLNCSFFMKQFEREEAERPAALGWR